MTEGLLNQIEVQKEDDLTEAVFGGLRLLENHVLEDIFGGISLEGELDIRFREKLESQSQRIPDAIIESESSVVLIEAKRGSPYNKSQLQEEYEDLSDYTEKERLLVLVTEHSSPPEGIGNVNVPEEEFMWIGWRKIYTELERIKHNNELHQTEERVIGLISGVLEDEGYTRFTGFEPVLDGDRSLQDETSDAWDTFAGTYDQLNTFRRDIDGQMSSGELIFKGLYRNGMSERADKLTDKWAFVTNHVWFTYKEPNSEMGSKKKDDYYYISFNLKSGEIRVGYVASPKHREEAKNLFKQNADTIAEYIDDEATLYQTNSNLYLRDEIKDGEEARKILTDEDWLTEEWRVHIGYSHVADELTDSTLTDTVADELVEIHRFVSSL